MDYKARFYSAYINRFLQPDTLIPSPANPQSWNRYAYTLNNAVNFSDPSGHKVCDEVDAYGNCYSYDDPKIDDIFGDEDKTIEDDDDQRCHTYHTCDVKTNFYEIGWQNFGQAWSIYWNPNATMLQRFGAGYYMGVWGGAHAGLVVGGVILTWEALVPGSMSCIGNPACQQKAIDTVNTGSIVVYRLVQDGVTRYYGITNNFARRAGEHLSQRGWQIQQIPGLQNLSRFDARAVEQVLIEQIGLTNLYNQINSIAVSNPIYSQAIQRGTTILQNLGLIH